MGSLFPPRKSYSSSQSGHCRSSFFPSPPTGSFLYRAHGVSTNILHINNRPHRILRSRVPVVYCFVFDSGRNRVCQASKNLEWKIQYLELSPWPCHPPARCSMFVDRLGRSMINRTSWVHSQTRDWQLRSSSSSCSGRSKIGFVRCMRWIPQLL